MSKTSRHIIFGTTFVTVRGIFPLICPDGYEYVLSVFGDDDVILNGLLSMLLVDVQVSYAMVIFRL